jgi:hypothetical protein
MFARFICSSCTTIVCLGVVIAFMYMYNIFNLTFVIGGACVTSHSVPAYHLLCFGTAVTSSLRHDRLIFRSRLLHSGVPLYQLTTPPSVMAPAATRTAGRDIFNDSVSGAQDRPWIPRLRSDPQGHQPLPHSLVEFREQEGADARERHFHELWKRLPNSASHPLDHEQHTIHTEKDVDEDEDGDNLSSQKAQELERQYVNELMGRCHGQMGPVRDKIRWKEFRKYAEAKEAGTWNSDIKCRIDRLTVHKSYGRSSTTSST